MNIPIHVAIIPDGNRRWAKARGILPVRGHMEGYSRFKDLVRCAIKEGVRFMTVWAFSTENFNRSEDEVKTLMKIIKRALINLYKDLKKERARFVHIGNRDRLTPDILELIDNLENESKIYTDFCLCVAVDYGGVDEILRAEKRLQKAKDPSKNLIDYLDTTIKGIPNPELIIRTGGELRTSGFMTLQGAYAEWIFDPTYFPDYDEVAMRNALHQYSLRIKRFGV